jgi:hypothetical protein
MSRGPCGICEKSTPLEGVSDFRSTGPQTERELVTKEFRVDTILRALNVVARRTF